MSFTPLMMKLVATVIEALPPQPSVIELGNQTFDPTLGGSLSAPEDCMFPRVIDHLSRRHPAADCAALSRLMALPPAAQKEHTASYYRALGFTRYEAIDVNARYGSLIMDLNVDLRETYGFAQTYDLCTNNGTGEHVFNQAAVFRNMHHLIQPGGVLLFVLPFYNWMNHGFFNFNPLLFADLAAANRYEVLRLSVGCPVGQEIACQEGVLHDNPMRLPWQPELPALTLADFQARGSIKPRTPRNMLSTLARTLTGRPTERQASRLNRAVEKLAERSANINIIAMLRKTVDAPFAAPLQGMYAGSNVETDGLRQRYGVA